MWNCKNGLKSLNFCEKMEKKFKQKKIVDFDRNFKKEAIKLGYELGVLIFVDNNNF